MTKLLSWIKCTGQIWCSLDTVNLSGPHFNGLEGIYVIWHGGPNSHTVYIGQGAIRDRLLSHRGDPRFVSYRPLGLYVTWAAVDAASRPGVESYLASLLRPLVGERHAEAPAIAVNSPWG